MAAMSSRSSSSQTVAAQDGSRTRQADLEKQDALQSTPPLNKPEVQEDEFLVTLEPQDDPKNIALFRKWLIVVIISTSSLCATCASSVAAFTELAIEKEFGVSAEVAILGVSLYVAGLGFGPLLVGPLSELYGRNIVYRVSFFLFWVFTWPVAFPPDIGTYLGFRLVTGFSSAAFLSVAGGSVSDLFINSEVNLPMAVFTISPFIGPVLGPLISGFINQNTNWRWTYRVMLIWIFVEMLCLILFVPETFVPVILKKKAQKMRKETKNDKYYAPLDKRDVSLAKSLLMSIYTPFKLLLLDRMALLLDLWNALLLGILYLAFQAFPIIFERGHHFSMQLTGLTFLGIGIGMIGGLLTTPFFNQWYKRIADRNGGKSKPETVLLMGQFGAVLVPISLYWLAFTTYPHVHWIVPIIASVPFGTGILYCFISTFTYMVTAYRPIAASAMAANTFVRTAFAAGFPLFAGQMYDTLGTVGATALLAGLTTAAAPLPFIFYRIGERVRTTSKFCAA